MRRSGPPAPVHFPVPTSRLVAADRRHPARSSFEQFVEGRFEAAFGARLTCHYPTLVGLTAPDGGVRAVAGVRFAAAEVLFLERYLDAPVEQAVAQAFSHPVVRDSIVEIGSFASDSPAASLELFEGLAASLSAQGGRRFAVATARPELERLLSRAGFGLRSLAAADPARLCDGAGAWGRYYDHSPQVFVSEIGVTASLAGLRARLRAKLAERQARRPRRAAS